MKIVINKCYGGFSLSMKAVRRIAELKGRPFYLFKRSAGIKGPFIPVPPDTKGDRLFSGLSAFDIPNPNEVLKDQDNWHELSQEERTASNERYSAHCHKERPEDRTDPVLVRVVEEMGKEASGGYADLAVVEIPDGVEWELDEYDGIESVHEKHRSWA